MNQFMTYSAFALGLTQMIFACNFLYSLVAGPKAAANPWHSNTLEWADIVAAAALQLRGHPDRLPRPLRIQRPGHRERLPATDRAAAAASRSARPGHGMSYWCRAGLAAIPRRIDDRMTSRPRTNSGTDPATLPARPALGGAVSPPCSPGRSCSSAAR